MCMCMCMCMCMHVFFTLVYPRDARDDAAPCPMSSPITAAGPGCVLARRRPVEEPAEEQTRDDAAHPEGLRLLDISLRLARRKA